MGGNTSFTKNGKTISAERIPLKEIGRDKFVKAFRKYLKTLNKLFYKEYNYYIWCSEKEIDNAGIFNGSTSFIMSPDYKSDEIVKYKSTAGDLDVAVPREYGKDIYNFLKTIEDKEIISGIKYLGNNANSEDKLGNTIICIVKAKFGNISVQAQMDLELSEMKDGCQAEWSKFAHSSTFDDAKAGIKGVMSKYLWRALVGTVDELDKGFLVAAPSSTPDKIKLVKKQPSKIRLLNFGVDSGVGAGYELMIKDNKPILIDGNKIYRKKKPAEKTYSKNLEELLQIVFGSNSSKINIKDTHSFVKVLDLINKYLDKKKKQHILDRFTEILFCNDGGQCQVIEPNEKEDVSIKLGTYEKAVNMLNLKKHKNIDDIVQKYVDKMHSKYESIRDFNNTINSIYTRLREIQNRD